MQIKSAVFTAVVLAAASNLSQAASVDIAASGSDAWNKTLVGTYVKNTKIHFSDSGKYTINLQDTGFVGNFEMLGAMISSPSTKYVDMVLAPEQKTKQQNFNIDKAGDYFLSVFAISDSINRPATFNLSVNAVPLPSAVIFMSSALMGLVAFMRRRNQQAKV
ncbi:MAG: hypothetical protein U1F46_02570 [Marinagarivorans sp.]